MAKNSTIRNAELRIRMIEAGVTQKQVAEVLEIRRDYLSRVMASEKMTDSFRKRILSAIQKLEVSA